MQGSLTVSLMAGASTAVFRKIGRHYCYDGRSGVVLLGSVDAIGNGARTVAAKF